MGAAPETRGEPPVRRSGRRAPGRPGELALAAGLTLWAAVLVCALSSGQPAYMLFAIPAALGICGRAYLALSEPDRDGWEL